MAAPLALVWDLIARDGASPTFARVAASADKAAVSTARAETGIVGFGKKAGAALAALATVDFAVHIVKDAAQFQKSMLLIQTQAGASSAQVKDFSAQILKMAGPLGTAPEALANSLYHVVSASKGILTGAQQLKVMQAAAEGAKVGGANLEETTNALTAAVASGIPGVQSYTQAMGALNTIVGAGDMKLSDLNEALGSGILVTAKQFGLSLTDVGAALDVFGDNNIRGANAATMLRQSITAMADPVAKGRKELETLGLTSSTLSDDMSRGGLSAAISDLATHLKDAGISGTQLGGVLTETFGKKAGPGISILVDQIDRFDLKMSQIKAGANGFAGAWAATQKSTSFALDRIRAGMESLAISLGTKLLPGVTAAADWLGTTLPADLGKLQSALAPVEHIVGETLVLAWRALAASLSVAGSALSGIVSVIGGHTRVFTDMATAALALWAAFKGATIAVAALKALDGALLAANARMLAFADSFAAVAAGQKAMSMGAFIGSLAAVGVAAYAVGKGLSSMIESNNSFAHVMDNSANSQKSFTEALNETNGALTTQVSRSVGAQLQSDGLAAKAHAAGISLNQLTGAVTGTDGAYASLVETWQKSGHASGDTITALGLLHAQYASAASGAKELATVTAQSASATTSAAAAEKAAADAAKSLDAALTSLAQTQLASAQSEDQFLEAINGVTKSLRDNGSSLSTSTAKGLANRDAFLSAVQSALSFKDAQEKAGASSRTAANALAANVQQLENQAVKAGASKTAVHALVAQMGLTPKDIRTQFSITDHASPVLREIQGRIDSIHGKTVVITAMEVTAGGFSTKGSAGVTLKGGASGTGPGGVPEGFFAVGEQGAELIHKSGSHVDVFSHSQSRAILAATGMRAPGFAAGSSKHITLPDGSVVPSQAAASNALTRAFKSLAAAVPKFIASLTKTTDQMKTAEAALLKDVKASGESKSILNKITDDFGKLNALATKRDALQAQLGTPDKAATQTAYEKLTDALSTYTGEISTVAQAITSGFNINSTTGTPSIAYQQAASRAAGGGVPMPGDEALLSAGDGTGSGGSASVPQILSSLKSQLGDATSFRSGLDKLIKEGLAPSLVKQLGEGGVSGSGATVEALASQATAAQIKQLNDMNAKLSAIAAGTGKDVANSVEGKQLREAQATVAELKAQTRTLVTEIRHIGSDVASALNGVASKSHQKARAK